MEQGTQLVPNVAALDKVTGKAIFYPTGSTAGVDLGVITMHKMDYGVERDDVVRFPIDGTIVLGTDDIIAVKPVFTLEGQMFHTSLLPLLMLGTANASIVQSSGTASTTAITAALGKTFDIGARNITVPVVTVSAVVKVADVDYFLEANKGIIRFPNTAAGIAAGASVVVTYDKPAITRESYTLFNNPNKEGTLQVFEMDTRSSVPKAEWSVAGTISAESAGEGDPVKAKKWSLRYSVTGQPTVLRRAA